jgi:ribosomal protein S18 acetylase RimI-like enzyme
VSRDVLVRPIAPCDLDALLALCREHAAYEKADFQDTGQVSRWHAALFSDQASLYGWIAADAGKPCGFMTVTIDYATWSAERFAYMDCLYLQSPYRGMGLGRTFLDRLREFCLAHRCGWVEWQTPSDNEIGIGFYRHMGVEAKPKLRFHYEVKPGNAP